MMDNLISILQWVIPSGGLGAVIAWFTSKTIRNIRTKKEEHDTYKVLYDDISETLKTLQDEMGNLHKELGRFRRAISKIYGCRYYPNCPVQHELQNSEGNIRKNRTRKSPRQPRVRNPTDKNDSGTGSESEADYPDTEPP